MEDLISRQTAIEMIVIEANKPGAYGYVDTKSIVDLLNKLPSEQGWVPCSERLPKEEICFPEVEIAFREVGATMSEAVIITVKTQNKYITDIGYTKNGHEWNCEAEGYKVIAWRPLPEPYREREGEND